MRSIADQSVAELGGARSVLSRQRRDHVELDALLLELGACTADEAGPLLVRTYRLVFPHAFAEEAVLWPVIRQVLPDGHELTLRVEREHQEINQLVTRLEELPRGSDDWRQVLAQVVRILTLDVRDEEDELLPRLQEKLRPAELRRLGFLWEIVRAVAPTRAHPIVSRRPPGNLLSALPLTLLDRARDRVDLRRYRRDNQNDYGANISGALTRATHAVERMPGLRSGEDPSTRVGRRSGSCWKIAAAATAAIAGAVLIARLRRTPELPASPR